MEKTFALRRHEVVRDVPMVEEFMARWPALFAVNQINAEFKRITTIPLQSRFLSQLDVHSDKLMKLFQKRGGLKQPLHKWQIVMSMLDESALSRESASTWVKIQKTLCNNTRAWIETPSMLLLEKPRSGFMFLKSMRQAKNLRTLELSSKVSGC